MTDDTTPPRSALATMRPPKAPTTAPSLFDELRELDAQLVAGGCNTNDRVITLAAACAENGVRALGQVIAVLGPLGHERRHVGAVLGEGRTPRGVTA